MIFDIFTIAAVTIAAFLAERFMIKNEGGAREKKHIGIAVAFGVLAIVLSVGIELGIAKLMGVDAIRPASWTVAPVVSFVFFLAVGFIEEACKFFPFAWFIRRKQFFDQVSDGVIYFAAVGLTFGVLEDVGYILQSQHGEGLLRLTIDLFFHAGLSGVIGYYFAKAHRLGTPLLPVGVAFVGIACLHAVFNICLSKGGVLLFAAFIITLFVNCNLFWLYYKASLMDAEIRLGEIPAPPMGPANEQVIRSEDPPFSAPEA